MLKTASKPVDTQDLQFKLQCRLNIFDKQEGNSSKSCKSLLASASRYGLVFAGCASAKLKVLGFESIENSSSREATKNYPRREIDLISAPYHICVNCDHTILAVVVQKDNCLSALFYDVLSFYKENVVLLNEVRLTSTPRLEVLQANWHPTLNNIFTECKSDGTLGIYELKDKSFDVKKLPAESKACCFCWSPKGKQIAVGSQDGRIIHYKPDLKAVKSIDAPPFEKPHTILSLQWISNYQFVGVFKMSQESDPECSVILIDAPKAGNPTFTNFYDICYSNGNLRPPQYYMITEQHWNILLVASANSMEVGVLSNTEEIWTQWTLPDSARAELPLDENQDETFPIGMAIDTSSDKPVLWGESYLQPAPCLMLLSHEGVLCCFKMVNLKEGAPSVNSPAKKVADMSGLRHFITPVPETVATPQEVPNVQEAAVPEKNVTSRSSTVAPSTQVNPGMFPLPSSTPMSASTVQPLAQGQQTPTTPLSIFKSPAPRQQFPSMPTNLFGGQLSITPVKGKETAPASSTASAGASLLSNILSEGSSAQRKEAAPGSIGSMPFSNILSGSNAAQTSINPLTKQAGLTAVSAGSSTSNRLSGSGQVQSLLGTGFSGSLTGVGAQLQPNNFHGTGFTLSSSSVTCQVQTGNLYGTNFTGTSSPATSNYPAISGVSPQNAQFGLQRTDTKPNVLSSTPNPPKPQTPGKSDINVEQTESADIKKMLTRMIKMECAALDKEIRDLIVQGQHLKIPLKPEDMDYIVQNTGDINEFLKELVETCEIQSSEIHILKQNTIQSWAWVEEARSRHKESQDQELRSLLKSKPLDSVSEKHLSTLKQMKYYLDSQLKQSHKALDDQWDSFQDYCRKNNRMQLPTMEAIFQTMVKQNAILQRHNYILKDITSQIKGKQKVSNNATLFNPLDKTDDLEVSFQNIKLEPENIHNIYYQKVLNRVKSVPVNKTNQLRRILHNREVPHVMAKSQLSTSALNSPLTASQQLSTTLKTPLGKKENSQLYQSTPMNLTPEFSLHISSTPSSAFAPTSNLASKPQVSTRFGLEPQNTTEFSISNFNKEQPSTPTNLSLLGEKHSTVAQSQISLFKTSANDKFGNKSFSNLGLNQERNQNMFGTNNNSVTSSSQFNSPTSQVNQQMQKFSPSVLISKQLTSNVVTSTTSMNSKSSNVLEPSVNSSVNTAQVGAQNKLFSFVSSMGQSNDCPNPSPATSTTGGFSLLTGSSIGGTASNTFGSSFFNSASNGANAFGKTGFAGTGGLFAPSSSNTYGSDSSSNMVSSTQASVPENSIQTAGSMFGVSATSDAAHSINGVSKTTTVGASNEAVPTTCGSIPSFNSDSNPTVTICNLPASNLVLTAATSTGDSNSASSTSVTSSGLVQPTTPSIFNLSLKKEEPSTDNKTIFGATPTTGAVSSSSKSMFAIPPTATGEVSSSTKPILDTTETNAEKITSSKSMFGTATTSSGVVSSNSNSMFGKSTNVGEASQNSKSIFGTMATNAGDPGSKSLFGANVASGGTGSTVTFSVFGNSVTEEASAVAGEVSVSSMSPFSTVPTTSQSIFGVSTTSGDSASNTTKSIFSNSVSSTSSVTSNNLVSGTSKSPFDTSISNSGAITKIPDTKTDTVQTTTKSIFNTTAPNTVGVATSTSIFGATSSISAAIPADTKSIFGTSATSSGVPPTASPSVFGASAASSEAAPTVSPSVFGAAAASSGTASTASPSIFGASATSSGNAATASSSIFGASTASSGTAPTATPSVFGASATSSETASTASPSIFGASATSSGNAPTASSSIFGASTASSGTAPTASSSIFGASTASSGTAPTASPSIFGASATSSGNAPTASSSILGASTASSGTAATASPSVFGATSSGTASTASPSIFGAAAAGEGALSLTTKSIFENATTNAGSTTKTTTTTNPQSPFRTSSLGAGNTKSTGSIFGNAATPSSPFGSTTGKSVFGSATSAGSPFSSNAPVSSSPFSSAPFASATNSNSVFGQATSTSSPFNTTSGAASPFSVNATNVQTPFGATPSTAESPFGAVAPSVCSPFGSQGFGPGFNANTTGQSSPFGQVSTSSNIFGSSNPTSSSTFGAAPSTENSSSPFNQSSGGIFGSFGSAGTKPAEGSFGFGSLDMGTASQSPFSKSNENKSPFGAATFNPTTSSGSLFGCGFGNNNGSSVFRQSVFGGNSAFSSTQQSGPFSGGSGSIAQTGFGIQSPQKSPAFGATPSFGGTPAFGSAPTFGGVPAFGSSSSFGSPNKVFGSPNPTPAGSTFGSTNTQQSSGFGSFASQSSFGFGNLTQQPNNPGANSTQGNGFGSFASQNTIGFGSLAQQSNNAGQNAPFSGASSFSSWR